MSHLATSTLLAVGLREQVSLLRELPLNIVITEAGLAAIEELRRYDAIEALISRWDLPDMLDGGLLRKLRKARPYLPKIVVLDEPDRAREQAARSLGALAVLPGDVTKEALCLTVIEVLARNVTLAEPTPAKIAG